MAYNTAPLRKILSRAVYDDKMHHELPRFLVRLNQLNKSNRKYYMIQDMRDK